MKMMYCKNCLQPNTRPNSRFDKEGVCPACRYYETLDEVDWDERRMEIEPMLEFGRQNSSCGYDCIIGVSGGKDSTRQALYVRDVLKMNPLLVCMCYPPQQVSQRGVDNLSNMIRLGFDCVVNQLAPETWRKAMRKAFLQFANWCRSTEYALYSSVPRTALLYQIPLVFWGENPALQLGDLKTIGKTGWDGNSLRNMNTLSGGGPFLARG